MFFALFVFLIGLLLSAFFSGSETGFYRVARVRLLIDAMAGDWIAKGLLTASNNPAAFVATALVGNNVANNVTALSIVMLTAAWLPGVPLAEMLLTFAITPLVFIFGELLPKKLFFRAPYRLLRRCAPGLTFAGVIFAPFSLLLWLVSQALQRISSSPAQTIRMALARRELSEVLDEGHAAGLLTPVQRRLAQEAFALGGRPIREFMVPAGRQTKATTDMSRRQVLQLAAREQQPALPVVDPGGARSVVGYVAAVDCLLDSGTKELPIQPMPQATGAETYLSVLLRTQAVASSMVSVCDAGGKTIGFVTLQRLREALLEEG